MNPKTILVPVDFSDVTTRVTGAARSLAAAFDGTLILLHVEEPQPDFVGFEPGAVPIQVPQVAERDQAATRQLENLRAIVEEGGVRATAVHTEGAVVERILATAAEHSADLIVVGSHGHGSLYNLLVGSIASGVLKDAPCPVLVVPSRKRD